jgi:hypothetical protein
MGMSFCSLAMLLKVWSMWQWTGGGRSWWNGPRILTVTSASGGLTLYTFSALLIFHLPVMAAREVRGGLGVMYAEGHGDDCNFPEELRICYLVRLMNKSRYP